MKSLQTNSYFCLRFSIEGRMRQLFLFFVFTLMLTVPRTSLAAWDNRSVTIDSLEDQSIFDATKEACTVTTSAQAYGHSFESDHLRIGHFRSRKFNEFLNQIQINSTKRALRSMSLFSRDPKILMVVNNTGFQAALKECYPNDERMVQFFETSVLNAEEKGRIPLIIATFAAGTSLSAGLARLGTFGVYFSHLLNFTQLASMAHEFYLFRKNIVSQKKQLAENCGRAKGEELNTCKKKMFFRALDENIKELQENSASPDELMQFLIERARQDIIRLNEDRKRVSKESELEAIDALIQQRKEYLLGVTSDR